jgi:hypothetical protein
MQSGSPRNRGSKCLELLDARGPGGRAVQPLAQFGRHFYPSTDSRPTCAEPGISRDRRQPEMRLLKSCETGFVQKSPLARGMREEIERRHNFAPRLRFGLVSSALHDRGATSDSVGQRNILWAATRSCPALRPIALRYPALTDMPSVARVSVMTLQPLPGTSSFATAVPHPPRSRPAHKSRERHQNANRPSCAISATGFRPVGAWSICR